MTTLQPGGGAQKYYPPFHNPALCSVFPGSLDCDSTGHGSDLCKTIKAKKTSVHLFPEASVTALL